MKYNPETDEVTDDFLNHDDAWEAVDTDRFHLKGMSDEVPKQIICSKCKGDKFEVMNAYCFTALKCCSCGMEFSVHEG